MREVVGLPEDVLDTLGEPLLDMEPVELGEIDSVAVGDGESLDEPVAEGDSDCDGVSVLVGEKDSVAELVSVTGADGETLALPESEAEPVELGVGE